MCECVCMCAHACVRVCMDVCMYVFHLIHPSLKKQKPHTKVRMGSYGCYRVHSVTIPACMPRASPEESDALEGLTQPHLVSGGRHHSSIVGGGYNMVYIYTCMHGTATIGSHLLFLNSQK